MLYNNLKSYLNGRYGGKVAKICIDGGFTCPNRDGTKSVGGCIFCGERGAGEFIETGNSISAQVRQFLSRPHAEDIFIAYFQNFTNTYAPLDVLEARYREALIDPRIVALVVATRPDCIDGDVARLLKRMSEKTDVWVELGFQTSNDATAEKINRGYKSEVFCEAVQVLHSYGIKAVVQIIVGLPGEDIEDVKRTVEFINGLPLWGIKIHCLYVMEGSRLATLYRVGQFTPQTEAEYVRSAVYVLTHINPDMVVHRITGDCPRGKLVAPEWNACKIEIKNAITRTLRERGEYQGIYFR